MDIFVWKEILRYKWHNVFSECHIVVCFPEFLSMLFQCVYCIKSDRIGRGKQGEGRSHSPCGGAQPPLSTRSQHAISPAISPKPRPSPTKFFHTIFPHSVWSALQHIWSAKKSVMCDLKCIITKNFYKLYQM